MLKVNTDGKRYKELREYWIFRILPEPKISKKGQLTHTLTNLALYYNILPLYNHNVVLIFDVVFILSTWDTKKGGPDTELGTYIGWGGMLVAIYLMRRPSLSFTASNSDLKRLRYGLLWKFVTHTCTDRQNCFHHYIDFPLCWWHNQGTCYEFQHMP